MEIKDISQLPPSIQINGIETAFCIKYRKSLKTWMVGYGWKIEYCGYGKTLEAALLGFEEAIQKDTFHQS